MISTCSQEELCRENILRSLASSISAIGIEKLTCFICYSWVYSDLDFIRSRLSVDLKKAGLDVVIDIDQNPPGSHIDLFTRLTGDIDRVIICCTPELSSCYEKDRVKLGTSIDNLRNRADVNVVSLELKQIVERAQNERRVKGENADYCSSIYPILLAGSRLTSIPTCFTQGGATHNDWPAVNVVYKDFIGTNKHSPPERYAYNKALWDLLKSLYRVKTENKVLLEDTFNLLWKEWEQKLERIRNDNGILDNKVYIRIWETSLGIENRFSIEIPEGTHKQECILFSEESCDNNSHLFFNQSLPPKNCIALYTLNREKIFNVFRDIKESIKSMELRGWELRSENMLVRKSGESFFLIVLRILKAGGIYDLFSSGKYCSSISYSAGSAKSLLELVKDVKIKEETLHPMTARLTPGETKTGEINLL